MLNYESLFADLAGIGLSSWRDELTGILTEKFSDSAHGKLGECRAVMSDLPVIEKLPADLSQQAVTVPRGGGTSESRVRESLLRLKPWR